MLINFDVPIYPDLVQEVLTTLQVPKTISKVDGKCIYFTVGGIAFHLSPDDIYRLMGFEELETQTVYDVARRHLEVPRPQAFWEELSKDRSRFFYSACAPPISSRTPTHSYITLLLTQFAEGPIHPRKSTKWNFLCLYAMIKKVLVHFRMIMAKLFHSHHNPNITKIYIGPYITVLVRGTQGLHIMEAPSGSHTVISEGMIEKLFTNKTEREKKRKMEQPPSDEELDAQQLEEFTSTTDEAGSSSGLPQERPGFLRRLLSEIAGLKIIL